MKIIDFSGSHCRHCYKCVRGCPVKAVSVRDSLAVIDEERCILCGQCLGLCPQHAKAHRSDLPAVRKMLADGEPVVLSVAPSHRSLASSLLCGQTGGFAGQANVPSGQASPFSPGQLAAALRRLGFFQVRETAEGAVCVTGEYQRLLREGDRDNILTTCCPGAVSLIEIHYPQLVPLLAPVVSPMIAHGLLIKKQLGSRTKVVFAGPCLAKMAEAKDPRRQSAVDAVLGFDELMSWLSGEGICPASCEPEPFDGEDPGVNRLYPIRGGILTAVDTAPGNESPAASGPYRRLFADGLEDCLELCQSLTQGELHRCLIEMNLCAGGCINGPLMPPTRRRRFCQQLDYQNEIPPRAPGADICVRLAQDISLAAGFQDRTPAAPLPTERQLLDILARTGKKTPADELNCGACGYPTCRDKAVAVFQGRAEMDMCIPYMHDQAASLSNLVMETSPNIVLIVNRSLEILEYSAVGERYFGKSRAEALQMKLDDFFDPRDFLEVLDTRQNIHGRKVSYPQYGLVTLQNIVYLPMQDGALATIIDITAAEKKAREEYARKLETIEMAQQVIDKQMTVAQQIAGLLGETTAETKVSLTKIGRILLEDSEEVHI